MKTILKLIIACICFIECQSQQKQKVVDNKYEIIIAKFYKIEEKTKNYVYHFKNDSIDGVFVQKKDCNIRNNSWRKIKLNKNYKLLLNRFNSFSTRSSGFSIDRDGDYEWNSDMEIVLFNYCGNVCGNRIYEMKY